MSDGDPNPAPLPGESESSLRTRRLALWAIIVAGTVGGPAVAYMISGWDAVIGPAVTVALLSLTFIGPELVRIQRTLRTLRDEPHANEGS